MQIVQEVSYRDIANHQHYRVGNDGSVWSQKRGEWRRLKSWKRKGYEWVALGRTKRTVHRLVLEAFVGQCPDGMEACHENDVKDDNRLSNLRWDTHKNNIDDLRTSGRLGLRQGGPAKRGVESHAAKLTEDQVREIRSLRGVRSQVKLAKEFGVSQALIGKIHLRTCWGWLP